ncbi:hypothetical protein [Altericroceibacterium spongiae]|uniref:hypothetical protein n=1 Tax=Altericroceibacterium spongiae TaxID=2320269 RepID=UPI0011C4A8DA|nr:hypothetical protein [Altericroceibacterium spongiae]
MARIDRSVQRMLIPKFELGLFENPYVDPDKTVFSIRQEADVALAGQTQREAQVLLQNATMSCR